MAPHSSTLAWKIPWMQESGVLQSMGSQRVRHDLANEQQKMTDKLKDMLSFPRTLKTKL